MCKWCEHSIRKPWFDWYWCYMLAYSCQSLPIHQADTFRASAYTYIYIFEFSILSLVVLWCLVQLCQCSICSITRRSSGWSALHPSLCSVTKSMFFQTIKLSDNRQSLAQVCGFHCGTNFEQNESEKRYQVGCLHEMLSICTLFDKLSKIM